MKLFILSILFLAFLQTSFAQKYEYNIEGIHFLDTLTNANLSKTTFEDIKVITYEGEERAFERTYLSAERKANFEKDNLDSTYIFHLVGEGETIEYILDLYQICTPCFVEWNNFEIIYKEFPIVGDKQIQPRTLSISSREITLDYLREYEIYEGEYLKVALKKDYEQGVTEKIKTKIVYQEFQNRIYVYDIVTQYGISYAQLCSWNNLDVNAYYVDNIRLVVGKVEYKYACPCIE
ncbi:hypothetical protein Fleli_1673 [Bernardetia litoralis DSM 6794]|uniref:LysM domain-containing protein n=1 Tax=Bernardetia litoralis (strain ATCC 23117 / DSM 6794 / NBRC 15988 / NCIMB 1366 / Fx l1 / Sio-4) TaxID=880071 RepID=I4AJE8_BERLS|nr:LysM peptidoglycan-binding domain-containing protein [Bernardetia litoralis]AFM04083.1 hypothetical protein Fleli_1673 [Bernardetia litoralis DSM 6794]